jgi:hypothetical protein
MARRLGLVEGGQGRGMDRQSAAPEELPPLELRKLRDLEVEEPSGPGRPAHLSAASGVVRRADFVYVIGDDELHLGVFELSSGRPGRLKRVLEGELPDGHGERSEEKPDLEALTLLPPFEDHPYGALLGLGSGSGPRRDRGFVCALAPDGSLGGEPREIDLGPVYALLREHIAELNVEGAATMGDRLWLLQRGNSELGSNVVAELSLDQVMRSLREDLRIDAEELDNVRAYDLGDIDGVALTFSDATPIAEQLLVFTASAEADDGGIRGSVVGTLGRDGSVERLRTIDRRWKVEGVHAAIDTGVLDFTFVCDQDDPDAPSPLLSATMPVEGKLEYEREGRGGRSRRGA